MKFNKLIPELTVKNLELSKKFYIESLGFKVDYERAEDKFVFLSREGSQLMLEEANDHWKTGDLEYPFGRGINFQIEILDPKSLAETLKKNGIEFFREITTNIYVTPNGDDEQTEFLVQDPDGYLFRFCN